MAKKNPEPEAWKHKDGRTRLVRTVDDRVKARFDGFKQAESPKAKAPAASPSTNK